MSLFYIKCDCGELISKIGTKNNVKGEKLKENKKNIGLAYLYLKIKYQARFAQNAINNTELMLL